jgi:hypothetical protein
MRGNDIETPFLIFFFGRRCNEYFIRGLPKYERWPFPLSTKQSTMPPISRQIGYPFYKITSSIRGFSYFRVRRVNTSVFSLRSKNSRPGRVILRAPGSGDPAEPDDRNAVMSGPSPAVNKLSRRKIKKGPQITQITRILVPKFLLICENQRNPWFLVISPCLSMELLVPFGQWLLNQRCLSFGCVFFLPQTRFSVTFSLVSQRGIDRLHHYF